MCQAGTGQGGAAGVEIGLEGHMSFPVIEILAPPVAVHEINASRGPRGVGKHSCGIHPILFQFRPDEATTVIISYLANESGLFAQLRDPARRISPGLPDVIYVLREVGFNGEINLVRIKINKGIHPGLADDHDIQGLGSGFHRKEYNRGLRIIPGNFITSNSDGNYSVALCALLKDNGIQPISFEVSEVYKEWMSTKKLQPPFVAVIGGGPAGLMAAEVLIQGGARVEVYEAKPSVGRKFLIAGKGGLNLTHSEAREAFLSRYGTRRARLEPLLDAFGPGRLRAWAHELGFDTFIGSSGRVFPVGLKAAPLLRAWTERLRAAGVQFYVRHRWTGWSADGDLRFITPRGERLLSPRAVVLALGGASWPKLGSDGGWVSLLEARGVDIAPLKPANCGFDVGWTEHFRTRFAGHPVKPVVLTFTGLRGNIFHQQGEFVATETGFEGSLIYAGSALFREEIAVVGQAVIHLDLAPDFTLEQLVEKLSRPRGSRSLSSHLQRQTGIKGVKAGLLWEVAAENFADPTYLAAAIKALPVTLIAPRPLDEAISTAGGATFEGLNDHLMLRALPGVFCAGEMLDWEAPTGGYLLTACFASGHAAGEGALHWLNGWK
jgi:uncharacterized flavoprotein (TIGR03862 family)